MIYINCVSIFRSVVRSFRRAAIVRNEHNFAHFQRIANSLYVIMIASTKLSGLFEWGSAQFIHFIDFNCNFNHALTFNSFQVEHSWWSIESDNHSLAAISKINSRCSGYIILYTSLYVSLFLLFFIVDIFVVKKWK